MRNPDAEDGGEAEEQTMRKQWVNREWLMDDAVGKGGGMLYLCK